MVKTILSHFQATTHCEWCGWCCSPKSDISLCSRSMQTGLAVHCALCAVCLSTAQHRWYSLCLPTRDCPDRVRRDFLDF